jgi:CBS domain-containing membrane protein
MAIPARRRPILRVEDVMTPNPATLGPDDTIAEAEEIMNEEGFRQIPLVNKKGLGGIITDRDIRSFLSGRLFGVPEDREVAMNTMIAAVMTTKPVAVAPDDDLSEAVELLIEGKIGGIPVVDEDEGLVGIVTYVDVLRKFLERLEES